MITSYHTHTTWSDGKASLEEQLEAARGAGLDELGFSDHYIIYPAGRDLDWSMPTARLGDYVEAILHLREHSPAPPVVRVGLEADFFPETVETLRARLALYPMDYVIGSVHYVDSFCVDEAPSLWEALSPDERREKWQLYWTRVRQLAESRTYDFVGHLDLPKKFGYFAPPGLEKLALEALDAIKAFDMAIELNTSGWSAPAAEAYPSPWLLGEACRREIPLLINADAHAPEHLTRNFDRARELARKAGYKQLVRFEKRQRVAVEL